MNWTTQLGNAVLAQRPEVMDAVQRMRQKARDFGYLRTNGQIIVSAGPYITILPARPDFYCVPYYDPAIVFVAPRPGFAVAGAINFGFGIGIGAAFRPWGWGGAHRLGYSRLVHRRSTVGPDMGESGVLRSPIQPAAL